MTWTIASNNLDFHQLLAEESLFFTGNGYLGIRGNFEEGYGLGETGIRGTYINGFYDVVDIPYGEKLFAFPDQQQKLVNVIDSQTIRIALVHDGIEEWFSLFNDSGKIIAYERKLHMDKGYSERIVHWRSKSGFEIKLHFKRLVSFVDRELFIQEVEIEPVNYHGKVKILSRINGNVKNFVNHNDPRIGSGNGKRVKVSQIKLEKNVAAIEVDTINSKLKAACAVTYDVSVDAIEEHIVNPDSVDSSFVFFLKKNTSFTKKSVYTDTLRHGDNPIQTAMALKKDISFAEALTLQKIYLDDFWNHADVQIEGDDRLQEGIRFNLYHMLQSAGQDSFSNISAKGLSGEGYEGHYFWDTEIYMMPVFLLTKPELARKLLLYRYSTLDKAKNLARTMGHKKGALFPWRTISGTECSAYFPSGTAQYHISADIAYSYIQYYLVTKDVGFLKDYGAEILVETARLWADIGHFYKGTYRIDAVTGPDEYTCIVNNNYYTNVMAKHNLTWAVKVYDFLKENFADDHKKLVEKLGLTEEEVITWKLAAQCMYLPFSEELNINPQDDTFLQKAKWDFGSVPKDHYPLLLHYHPLTLYRYQVCKQPDTVLAHFLLEDEQDFSVIKDSYDYYEQITTHDSSLSTCIFSIMACKVGYFEKAYNYFMQTARLDLDNIQGNTRDGLHMANMAGTWMAIVFGFAGLRIKESGLSFNPCIPNGWNRFSFTLQYEGRILKVKIGKKNVQIRLEKGESLRVKLYGKEYIVSKQQFAETELLEGNLQKM